MAVLMKCVLRCDRCLATSAEVVREGGRPIDADAYRGRMGTEGWTRAGAGRLDLCRSCSAETARRSSRAGFTLTELLAVMAIVALVSAVALPTIVASWSDRGPTAGAGVVQAAIERARDLASSAGTVGVRFVPDPAWPIVRRADGTIDPERPLAYSRITPLIQPPPYAEGLASARADGYPAAFVAGGWALPGRLILEEAVFDGKPYTLGGVYHPEGGRCNPTSWFWNVRVGDVVQYLGRSYTVAGPMVVDNAEGFVNVGPAGVTSPLDRAEDGKSRPAEFLYMTNRVDDNQDGWIDSGWDGIDNDLDGFTDEADEWEDERWIGLAAEGVTGAPYVAARRPAAGPGAGAELPAGFVVDATGWASAPAWHGEASWTDRAGVSRDAPGWDYTGLRSRLPVDVQTGAVELMFDRIGQVDAPSLYGKPAARPLGATHLHFWVASRADVLSPPTPRGAGKLVSIQFRTGRSEVVEADAADPAGTFARGEGRGR